MSWALDHLVVACPDLAQAVAQFADRLGAAPADGGPHGADLGTANALYALEVPGAPAYLELIGPDPRSIDAVRARPRSFGIDTLAAPTLVAWAVRYEEEPDDGGPGRGFDSALARLRAGGWDPGEPVDRTRRSPDGTQLRWRMTSLATRASDDVLPFALVWLGPSPSATPGGLPWVRLDELSIGTGDPRAVREVLGLLRVDVAVREQSEGLSAALRGPGGGLLLSAAGAVPLPP